MAPTIRDVAREAGVSPATVSRVMTGSQRVSATLAARVREAAHRIGYAPSGIRTSSGTPSLGVFVQWPAHHGGSYYTLTLIREIAQAAQPHGIDIVVRFADEVRRHTHEDRDRLPQGIAGALLIGSFVELEEEYVRMLDRAGVPFFLFSRGPENGQHNYVAVDDFNGALEATRHLISLGHGRIAHVSGPPNSRDARDRRRAFEQACDDAGIPPEDRVVIQGDYLEESGFQAGMRLMAMDDPPTAVFAANDMMAIGLCRALQARGRRVPDDMAVVGFDDIDLATYCDPPLSTVHVPLAHMARLATEQLIAQLKRGEVSYSKTVLGGHLVVRRSCGSPAGTERLSDGKTMGSNASIATTSIQG